MDASQIYILIACVVLLVVAVFFGFARKKKEKMTPLTILAFLFVIAGICFGDSQWIGYGLMGIGVLLAVIDIIRKFKSKHK